MPSLIFMVLPYHISVDFAPPESLLRDEIEVEPEVLQHVAQVDRRVRNRIAQELQVCPGKLVSHLAGLLEAGILEIGVKFEFVFHGSSISFSGLTLHRSAVGIHQATRVDP